MKIQVFEVSGKTKSYISNLGRLEFTSLPDLVMAIFENHRHGQSELNQIQDLLDYLGINNLKEISADDIPRVREIVVEMLPTWSDDHDAEKLTYKLLAAILNNQVLVLVDDKIIEKTNAPLRLKPDSKIVFIQKEKLSAITFKTL